MRTRIDDDDNEGKREERRGDERRGRKEDLVASMSTREACREFSRDELKYLSIIDLSASLQSHSCAE
jgi:hypothetical protein